MASMAFGKRWWLSVLGALMLVVTATRPASADTLSLLWDPSPDASATGYVVYVGTESGAYTSTYDVGSATSFAFVEAVPGRHYFFAVAAYAPGPALGPHSTEVSGITDEAPEVTNNPPPEPTNPETPPSPAVDLTPPVLTITVPTTDVDYVTRFGFVMLGGTVVDDVEVTAVEWASDRGGSGRATRTGTNIWLAGVRLQPGRNEITLTATDEAENTSEVEISIHRE